MEFPFQGGETGSKPRDHMVSDRIWLQRERKQIKEIGGRGAILGWGLGKDFLRRWHWNRDLNGVSGKPCDR